MKTYWDAAVESMAAKPGIIPAIEFKLTVIVPVTELAALEDDFIEYCREVGSCIITSAKPVNFDQDLREYET